MRNKIKKQVPDRNKPLVEKEELENLIKEMMTDKEVEEMCIRDSSCNTHKKAVFRIQKPVHQQLQE